MAMLQIYDDVSAACDGYRPTQFRRLVTEEGGLGAARLVLHGTNPSGGFNELVRCNRLELSMEALVTKEPWCQLFTPEELGQARKRLADVGFSNSLHSRTNQVRANQETLVRAPEVCTSRLRDRELRSNPAPERDCSRASSLKRMKVLRHGSSCRLNRVVLQGDRIKRHTQNDRARRARVADAMPRLPSNDVHVNVVANHVVDLAVALGTLCKHMAVMLPESLSRNGQNGSQLQPFASIAVRPLLDSGEHLWSRPFDSCQQQALPIDYHAQFPATRMAPHFADGRDRMVAIRLGQTKTLG